MSMGQIKSYRMVASDVPFEHEKKGEIFSTFFAVSDYYKRNPNPGACHLIAGVLHVLLKEQGIENDLCIGEVSSNIPSFDHSWVEIDGKVFDVAIQLTLDERKHAPVYAGYDLETERRTHWEYGVESGFGMDMTAIQVYKTPFVKYMDGYPQYSEGAWRIILDIGKSLRIRLDRKTLRDKYKDTIRIHRVVTK